MSDSQLQVTNQQVAGQLQKTTAGIVLTKQRHWYRTIVICVLVVLLLIIAAFLIWESRVSWLQSGILTHIASHLSYKTEPGPSPCIIFPNTGPYDKRLGYSDLKSFVDRLQANGYEVEAQSRFSPLLYDLTGAGIFTTYHEKTKAGICVLDRDDNLIFASYYPKRVYRSFEYIPDLVVKTLLFIENRDLLDQSHPYRNPAIEWDRFAKAIFDKALNTLFESHDFTGGSTLATQLEKYKHSNEGRTSTGTDKIRQMISASLRAYIDGRETMAAQHQIILDYVNSIPLAAISGYGEVNSLGDGLWAWYGSDFDFVNISLSSGSTGSSEIDLDIRALVYKQVLSLFLAHRRPSFYLVENQNALEPLTNEYIRLLAKNGIISRQMRDAALRAPLRFCRTAPEQLDIPFMELKAANAIRTKLFTLLGVPQLYELDRLDLTVKSTLDRSTQDEVVKLLQQAGDPAFASSFGLTGYRLLSGGADPSRVIYSFTLYEHVNNTNLLRVQADSFDQPLNINEGVKLELGSTAKLRTLVTYLEIIADLHNQYAKLSQSELIGIRVPSSDRLSQWAINYLMNTSDRNLLPMLEAAMQRQYSGSPGEAFFTGGGQHRFSNFEGKHNGMMSVEKALQQSVNLVFIRLMRDIVNYYMYQVPGSTARVLGDENDPARQTYLSRFADREGGVFLRRFYRKYYQKTPEEMLETLLQGVYPIPSRLAVVFRSVISEAEINEFASFMRSHLPNSNLDYDDILGLYEHYSKSAFNLADRGYIARIHPLELWAVEYLYKHPGASMTEMMDASANERQEVYKWLFKAGRKHAQDIRIRTILEIEAFQQIHAAWKRLGYPFDSLVPSYATAIGSSADRPAALADLVGIILNNGVRYPTLRIEELHFAEKTPYESIMRNKAEAGEQVLLQEIARVVKNALIGVVEDGTAQRARKAFTRPDGSVIVLGGKTGTGDNRRDIYGSRGRLIESKAINRTATFVFFIGDRFYGTITAYVEGPEAGKFKFTSSLPTQMMKILAPKLMPLIDRTYKRPDTTPPAIASRNS